MKYLYLVIVISLMIGCNAQKKEKETDSVAPQNNPGDSGMTEGMPKLFHNSQWPFELSKPDDQGYFTYSVIKYPTTKSCEETKSELQAEFDRLSSMPAFSSICTPDDVGTVNISIKYSKNSPIEAYSTYRFAFHGDSSFAGNENFYKSESECQQDLPNAISRFKTHVNIDPFVAYCLYRNHNSEYRYLARIDVIGSPSLKPSVLSVSSGRWKGGFEGHEQETEEILKEKALMLGLIEPTISVRLGEAIMHFFSTQNIGLKEGLNSYSDRAYVFQSYQECRDAKTSAQFVVEKTGSQLFETLCSIYDDQGSARLITLVFDQGSQTEYVMSIAPIVYQSLNECRNDIDRVISTHPNQANVLGIICAFQKDSNQKYAAHVFTAKGQ